MTVISLLLLLWAGGGQALSVSTAPADLTAARALYAAGNYEDALSRLPPSPGDAMVGEVDEYRALCLLALGRSTDAERTLEDLVTRQPLFKMTEADLSPRLVTMFRDTRKRLLPAAVRGLYTKAKSDYDEHQYAAAASEFKDLMTLLSDEDLAPALAGFADLKMLADGFLTLSESEVTAAAKAAAAAPPAPVPPPAPHDPPASASPPAPTVVKIYTETDTTVEPPVAISTPYPSWHPPNSVANREYHGMLRIVIDVTGHVESAAMVVSVSPSYDPLLLAAVKDWTYKAAQLDGAAVKYQKTIAVSLSPR
jgi:hypothetical protein